MAGTAVLGRLDEAALLRFAGVNRIQLGFELDDEPWRIVSLTCVGAVVDDATHAAAIDAVLRGADIVADVEQGRADRFAADLARAGIATWSPSEETSTGAEWAPLLLELAAGASVQEAARRCNLSLRTAHRRLAAARSHLGVTSNAEAVATWSHVRGTPADD